MYYIKIVHRELSTIVKLTQKMRKPGKMLGHSVYDIVNSVHRRNSIRQLLTILLLPN